MARADEVLLRLGNPRFYSRDLIDLIFLHARAICARDQDWFDGCHGLDDEPSVKLALNAGADAAERKICAAFKKEL